MADRRSIAARYRFGAFEVDCAARELRKGGTLLKLGEQPLTILIALLERAGQEVRRDEIQRELWPHGTHVDFEKSINSAVNKLRDALADSADRPRYIETVPRRGYRFIAPIEADLGLATDNVYGAASTPSNHRTRWRLALAAALALTLACTAAAYLIRRHSAAEEIHSLLILPFSPETPATPNISAPESASS